MNAYPPNTRKYIETRTVPCPTLASSILPNLAAPHLSLRSRALHYNNCISLPYTTLYKLHYPTPLHKSDT